MCAGLCQTKLLTRAEEYELGTKIQALMRQKELRQQLAARLGRPPSWAEWAEACRLTVMELEVRSLTSLAVVVVGFLLMLGGDTETRAALTLNPGPKRAATR